MFDFHMHSTVSFDGSGAPLDMCQAAVRAGLQEICFTDHYDYNSDPAGQRYLFSLEEYSAAYDHLSVPGLTVRRGVEFGLTTWNQPDLQQLLHTRHFDFVLGSVHFVDGVDPYEERFWTDRSVEQSFRRFLEGTLECVRVQEDYDVLGHLTYVCKSVYNPSHAGVPYEDFRDITDEILKTLVSKGKGMEINTSGVDRAGTFLPSAPFLRRFKELGGQIVTVGSDAHDPSRVGQYTPQALEILKDIFGYVCTFADRQPVFHKL